MLRARRVGGDEGQVDLRLCRRRQLNLRLLGRLTDTLDGNRVTLEVEAGILLELLQDVLDEDDVEVLATKVSVTVRRLDLEDTLLHLENRDIESSTTKIVHRNDRVVCTVKTVREGGSSGLVDYTEDIKARDGTRVLRCLPLCVVEVSRDGDNSMATKW